MSSIASPPALRSARWFAAVITAARATVIFAMPAHAADRSDVIDRTSITVTSTSSANPDDPLVQWQSVEISFGFSTEDAAEQPTPGDTFTMSLPEEFRTSNLSFALVHPDGTTLGHCTAGGQPSVVTCTFAEAVTKYSYVYGEVWVKAQAVAVTDVESVEFIIDGKVVDVDLPGDGGIIGDNPQFPDTSEKWGWFYDGDRDSILWSLFIVGNETGTADPLVITDQLGPGQTMAPGWRIDVQDKQGGDSWTTIASDSDPNGVKMSMSTTSFELTVPRSMIDDSALYRVNYLSNTTTLGTGQSYANTAIFASQQVTESVQRTVEGAANINGAGYGGIGVLKLPIAGDGAALVPADTIFTVQATYLVEGVQQTKTIEVTAGGDAGLLNGLPTGTVVTLSEVATPAVDGIGWGTPAFSSSMNPNDVSVLDGGSSAAVTIRDQQTTYIELTNTATTTTVTPSPTEPTQPTEPSEPTQPTEPTSPAASPTSQAPGPAGSEPSTGPDAVPPAASHGSESPDLARTGSDLGALGGAAAGLVIAGVAPARLGRRR